MLGGVGGGVTLPEASAGGAVNPAKNTRASAAMRAPISFESPKAPFGCNVLQFMFVMFFFSFDLRLIWPTLMSEDLIQRVTKVIATSKRIPLETVTIDSEFAQLGIDSMDAVEILFALEGEFDISIPDEEVRSVRNVRDMCAGVERLVAAKNADAPAGQ